MNTKTPTYKEQFDKLTRAYISNEVNPNQGCACFVGNILNNYGGWTYVRDLNCDGSEVDPVITNFGAMKAILNDITNGFYTPFEIIDLEKIFLDTYYNNGGDPFDSDEDIVGDIKENALFIAFEKSLERLKQIHQSKGEVIDEVPKFTKRELQKTA